MSKWLYDTYSASPNGMVLNLYLWLYQISSSDWWIVNRLLTYLITSYCWLRSYYSPSSQWHGTVCPNGTVQSVRSWVLSGPVLLFNLVLVQSVRSWVLSGPTWMIKTDIWNINISQNHGYWISVYTTSEYMHFQQKKKHTKDWNTRYLFSQHICSENI